MIPHPRTLLKIVKSLIEEIYMMRKMRINVAERLFRKDSLEEVAWRKTFLTSN